MGRLINIDNGGTLTDVCVIDGNAVHRTKTLTTPHDLSRCFIEGLKNASALLYGKPDLVALLRSTDYIRYSTTQGTNAIVEKKGPRVGVVFTGRLDADDLRKGSAESEFFAAVVGDRVAYVATEDDADLELTVVQAVNALTSAGANRIVVAHGGADPATSEARVRRIAEAKFPKHLLGAVPILYSHELVDDEDDTRRAWTAIFNAFLHPAMEKFLYNAEHQLRASKNQNPLLIFRNDGLSARVAKTTAVRTYSSGPRGGMEGVRAVAEHYGFPHVLSMDVGGTTTDFGEVRSDGFRINRHGKVQGIPTSFPLCDLVSVGVGGSSIIEADGDTIKVGPESVGSAPGPACFGLGGRRATITDAVLLSGLLDPKYYFGGRLDLDRDRAAAAVAENVATALGLTVEAAVESMQKAWVGSIATAARALTTISPDTTLAAFGGAGPLLACEIADAAGINRVLIPGLAPVFSAYGLGFSDIGHRYQTRLEEADVDAVRLTLSELLDRAKRDMFAEGVELDECTVETVIEHGSDEAIIVTDVPGFLGGAPLGLPAGADLTVWLSVTHAIPHPQLSGEFSVRPAAELPAAVVDDTRRVRRGGQLGGLPVYRVEGQRGVCASGPAVLEDDYFTSRIDPSWQFQINDNGDILLSRSPASQDQE